MTEDEAKTKICCGLPQTISGRPPLLRCFASGCMAWSASFEREETQANLMPSGAGWEKDGLATGVGGAVTHRQKWRRAVGYCGIVGR